MENRLNKKKDSAFSIGFTDPEKNVKFGKMQLEEAKKDMDTCNAYLLLTTHDETYRAKSCLGKKTGLVKSANIVHLVCGFFKWLSLLVKDGNYALLLVVMAEMNKLINEMKDK